MRLTGECMKCLWMFYKVVDPITFQKKNANRIKNLMGRWTVPQNWSDRKIDLLQNSASRQEFSLRGMLRQRIKIFKLSQMVKPLAFEPDYLTSIPVFNLLGGRKELAPTSWLQTFISKSWKWFLHLSQKIYKEM